MPATEGLCILLLDEGNFIEATKYYDKADAVRANGILGDWYYHGIGIEQNYDKSFFIIRRSFCWVHNINTFMSDLISIQQKEQKITIRKLINNFSYLTK